jgi:hypothetical protein
MILHGLSHKLMKMCLCPNVRNVMNNVVDHFKLSISDTHRYEVQTSLLKLSKIAIKILIQLNPS